MRFFSPTPVAAGIAALLLLPTFGFGQVEGTVGKKYALLVGIERYNRDSGLRALEFACDDVRALAEILTARGYSRENVRLRAFDAESKAVEEESVTAEGLRNDLDWLDKNVEPGDSVVLALSGHGVMVDDVAYFCAYDANPSRPATLTKIDAVLEAVSRLKASKKLVLIDACRDRRTRGAADETLRLAGLRSAQGRNTLVLFSCGDGQVSVEDPKLKRGVFSHYVIEALKGADEAKDRSLGAVTFRSLQRYVNERVPRHDPARPQKPFSRSDKEQADFEDLPVFDRWPDLIALSNRSLRLGDVDVALAHARRAAEEARNAETHAHAAVVSLRADRIDDAARYAHDAVELARDDLAGARFKIDGLWVEGECLLRKGAGDDAVNRFQKAAELCRVPTSDIPRTELVRCLDGLCRANETLGRSGPTAESAREIAGLFKTAEQAGADPDLARWFASAWFRVVRHAREADAKTLAARSDEALVALERYVLQQRDFAKEEALDFDARLSLARGESAYRRGNTEEARLHFKSASDRAPDRGVKRAAVDRLRQIEQAVDDPARRLDLAVGLLAAPDRESALAAKRHFEWLIAHGRRATGRLGLGICLETLGQTGTAQANYAEALARARRDDDAERLAAECDRLAEAAPEVSAVYKTRAVARSLLKREAEAEADREKAKKLDEAKTRSEAGADEDAETKK